MSELPTNPSVQDSGTPPLAVHPGVRIRQAREARALQLSQLSILLKIPERRLQAYEEGRWDEVGDRTFVRALTQSLARQLGLEVGPLLNALPIAETGPREAPNRGTLPNAGGGLRSGRRFAGRSAEWSSLPEWMHRPTTWLGAVFVAAAVALAALPSGWLSGLWSAGEVAPSTVTQVIEGPAAGTAPPALPQPVPGQGGASEPLKPSGAPAITAAGGTPSASTAVGTAPAGLPAAPSPAPASPSGTDTSQAAAEGPSLRIRAVQSSWIQVHDARGQPLLSRLVTAGEVIDLDGRRPLKLRVGNVSGTEVQWKGRRLDLESAQRNNVAQLDLE